MMGPYGKGAGKSGLICFANVVSLDFCQIEQTGMSWKNKAPTKAWKITLKLKLFKDFSLEMICIKLWNSVDSWSLGSQDAKIFSDANLGPRVLLGLQLTSNPHFLTVSTPRNV